LFHALPIFAWVCFSFHLYIAFILAIFIMQNSFIGYDVLNKLAIPQPKQYLHVRIIYYIFSLISAIVGYFEDISEEARVSSDNNLNSAPLFFGS
jgi:hypothetical protein